MASEITRRFIECYKDLKSYDRIKSDRQFCSNLGYSPQSWQKILKGERDVTIELLRTSISNFGFNPDYLFSGQGEKFRSYDDNNQADISEHAERRIIHIPVTAKAGYLDQINDPVFSKSLRTYSLPLDYFSSGEFRSFEVEGDSMEPVLTDGEIIICTQLEDQVLWKNNIKSGYVYVIVLKNDLVVKRVFNRLKEENKLQLISDNPDYPDLIVDQEDVFEMWNVKMKISPFAHSKINLRQEMVNNYSELHKTIKSQSEIIANLHSVVEKMLQKNRLL
jgi:phage repressor protein C with HTH and peptisase S24 domain